MTVVTFLCHFLNRKYRHSVKHGMGWRRMDFIQLIQDGTLTGKNMLTLREKFFL